MELLENYNYVLAFQLMVLGSVVWSLNVLFSQMGVLHCMVALSFSYG